MDNINNLIDEISELKSSIINEYISSEKAVYEINKIEKSINTSKAETEIVKADTLKSLMITFNTSNFSDMTVFFTVNDTGCRFIEKTGDTLLCNKIEEFLNDDPFFYKGMDRIEISGNYYRMFYESMIKNDTVFTVISLTLSNNFRSTRFHILCDLLMDYINSAEESRKGLFSDLFDYTVIELTKFLSLSEEKEPDIFFFRFEYISEFFLNIGLSIIIEMSTHIKNSLLELFGNNASIIRLSLSSYIVVTSKGTGSSNSDRFMKKNRMNFSFKGIILPYTVIQIPYKKENSIYDIFENVYLLNNYMRNGDVKI